jgi:esterase/lipase
MKKILFLLFAALFLAGCTNLNISQNQSNNMEKINFTTSDGWIIVANYYPAPGNAVILLHKFASDKSEWTFFANELNQKGYAVVALDFRGHGESTRNGRAITWQSFTNADFNDMTKDVSAARDWLTNKGYDEYAIVGASIGANTALNYAVNDSAVKTIVLLSPGLEFKGIVTNQTIRNFTKPIFIVASNEDTYSARSATILYESTAGKKEIKLYDGAGHGVAMFARTDLDRLILNWLKDNFP